MHTRRTLAMVALVLVGAMLAGCGGDDADSNGNAAADEDEGSPPGGSDGGSEETSEEAGGGAAGSGTAVVTVGDTTYEFEISMCQELMGGLVVAGQPADGSDIQLRASLPPTDMAESEPPDLTVDDAVSDERWEASESLAEAYTTIEPGQSGVTVDSLDGGEASGTASFVDTNAALSGAVESVPGTFRISCP